MCRSQHPSERYSKEKYRRVRRRTRRKLDDAVDPDGDRRFEYFGLRTVYDRYLLRHPQTRAGDRDAAVLLPARRLRPVRRRRPRRSSFYRLISSLAYLPSSPTLFNSGTRHTADVALLPARLARATSWTRSTSATPQVAQLSKFSGGIGLAYHRVRSRGSLIRGTNGQSNGIVPWLQDARRRRSPRSTRAASARARPASTWSRGTPTSRSSSSCATTPATTPGARTTSTSPTGSRTCSCAASRPTATWSLFDPKEVPRAPRPVRRGVRRRVPRRPRPTGAAVRHGARPATCTARMMRTLAQTGNGWMTFKDAANRACNQTGDAGQRRAPVEPLHRDHRGDQRRRDRGLQPRLDQPRAPHRRRRRRRHRLGASCARTVRTAVPFLDRVIDINYYPIAQAAASNPRWRPVGLGRDGPAGRVLPAAAAVRLRPRRASCPRGSPRRSTCTALRDLRRAGRASTARTRRSPRRARPRRAAVRPVGRRRRRRPARWDALRARDRGARACATRC